MKAFLVKYGVNDAQITTSGDGNAPEVDNKTKEGRFMNRRVVLTVTDGGGRLIKEGGIGDVINALMAKLDDMREEAAGMLRCHSQEARQADDILASLKNLQGGTTNCAPRWTICVTSTTC